jgi:hypothetical protein
MKQHLLFIGFIFTSVIGTAQEVSWFQAEQNNYYDIQGCVAKSDVQFYSTPGGGKLLRQTTVNSEGKLLLMSEQGFKPAFCLSMKDKNSSGIAGSGMVRFFDTKEFSFSSPTVERKNGTATITWKAEHVQDALTFDVLKSTDGINYVNVGTVAAPENTCEQEYSYTDKNFSLDATYKVQVSSYAKGVRYTSRVIQLAQAEEVLLYPTVASNDITVMISSKLVAAGYTIINMQGQKVADGVLNEYSNSINVSSLNPGVYTFIINNGGKTISKRLEKL